MDEDHIRRRVYERLNETLSFLARQDSLALGLAILHIAELMKSKRGVTLTPALVKEWWRGVLKSHLMAENLLKDQRMVENIRKLIDDVVEWNPPRCWACGKSLEKDGDDEGRWARCLNCSNCICRSCYLNGERCGCIQPMLPFDIDWKGGVS